MLGLKGERKVVDADFLLEAEHLAGLAHLDDAELLHVVGRNGQRGQRYLGAFFLVVGQHAAVIHLVDVIARRG